MCLASAAACGYHRDHAVVFRAVVDRARPVSLQDLGTWVLRPLHRGAHMAHIGTVGGSVCDLVSRRTLSRGARRAHRAVRAEPRVHSDTFYSTHVHRTSREKRLWGARCSLTESCYAVSEGCQGTPPAPPV